MPAATTETAQQALTQPAPQPTGEPSPTSASQATAAPTPTVAPRREHVVAPGDTLFDIARRYGTAVDALVVANRLPNRNVTLQVGQRLIIPG
jgi:LysM repeat protein